MKKKQALERLEALSQANKVSPGYRRLLKMAIEAGFQTSEKKGEPLKKKPLVYLACPYSDPNPLVMTARFLEANEMAAKMVNAGYVVFSPISHFHPIAEAGKLPTSWEFWEKIDRAYLSVCSQIFVLRLPGWKISKGVNAEIAIAKEIGIPVIYLDRAGNIYL